MDLEHGDGSNKQSRTYTATEELPSSNSSVEDCFPVGTNIATKNQDAQPELKESSSQVFEFSQEPLFHPMSPTQSPPVQLMERSGADEPYRIPSSVFSRSHSGTPVEWSVASNESLFSIHMGNGSLSREHFFMLDGDYAKSGELTKSGEFIVFSSSPPPRLEENSRKSAEKELPFETTAVADEPIKDNVPVPPTSADQNCEKRAQPNVSLNSCSMRHSDASAASNRSFTFPIKKKRACPSCYCSNCSWAFCYCTWPNCDCSKCSWAFCYFWNCSGHCCFSSTILTEEERNGSIKEQLQKLPPEKQPPPTTAAEPNLSDTTNDNWFSCARCPYSCC